MSIINVLPRSSTSADSNAGTSDATSGRVSNSRRALQNRKEQKNKAKDETADTMKEAINTFTEYTKSKMAKDSAQVAFQNFADSLVSDLVRVPPNIIN